MFYDKLVYANLVCSDVLFKLEYEMYAPRADLTKGALRPLYYYYQHHYYQRWMQSVVSREWRRVQMPPQGQISCCCVPGTGTP